MTLVQKANPLFGENCPAADCSCGELCEIFTSATIIYTYYYYYYYYYYYNYYYYYYCGEVCEIFTGSRCC